MNDSRIPVSGPRDEVPSPADWDALRDALKAIIVMGERLIAQLDQGKAIR